jgi:hypothetical protein
MQSNHPVGRYCFGLRLFSLDFSLNVPHIQLGCTLWLQPTHALSSARSQGTVALRAIL